MPIKELFRRYGRPFWREILLIVLVTVAANLLALTSPAIIAAALAAFTAGRPRASVAGGGALDLNRLGDRVLAHLPIPANAHFSLIVTVLAVAYLAQTCATAGLNYFDSRLTLRVRTRTAERIRMDLLRHLLTLPLSFFNRQKSGELVARLTQDAQAVGQGLGPLVRSMIHQNLQLIGFAAYLLGTNAWLTLVAIAVIAAHLGVSHLLKRGLRTATRDLTDSQADFTATVQESLTAIRVAKSFGAEPYTLARLEGSVSKVMEASSAEGEIQRLQDSTRSALDSLAIFAIFVFAAVQVQAGRLTLEGLVLYVYVGRLIIAPANQIGTNVLWFQSLLASFDRIGELLRTQSSLVDGPGRIDRFERAIELKSVTFSYGPHLALDDVSLEIPRGSVVALVGPSGAGKSTLTDLILRLYDPDSGQICIDGIDLHRLTQGPYRRHFGVVSQENLLFHDTVENNIRYGREAVSHDDVVRAAQIANAHDFITRLPLGYATLVGDRGALLSGGERQRVAIARAIVMRPEILILDEATSALDSESERQVQLAVERVTRGVTSIIVAHRLSTVRHADTIVVMDRGRVVDQGRHEDLLGRCPLSGRLCELQFGRLEGEAMLAPAGPQTMSETA